MNKKILDSLNEISMVFEDLGMDKQANIVNEIFLKVAKKKSKTKKNVPTNPSLWSECKAWAKRTFDVYPSAYANGAAAKRYKSKGGGWKKASSESNLRIAQDVSIASWVYDANGNKYPFSKFNEAEQDELATTGKVVSNGITYTTKEPEYKPTVDKNIYKTIIDQIKNLILSNDKEAAHTLYSDSIIGPQLNQAQKQALDVQYHSILDRFTSNDKGFDLSNTKFQQNLLDVDTKANTYVDNFIRRLNIDKSRIMNDTTEFNSISKLISTIKDKNIKNKALDILKSIATMNYRKLLTSKQKDGS